MARQNHLDTARLHRHKAFLELKRLAADSALHWILSHQERVTKFRRAIRNTAAEAPFARILGDIRKEATVLRGKPRKPHAKRAAAAKLPAYGTYF